jgi:hypothetical protein
MENKLNSRLGKMILGMLVVMFTTSAYAACTTTTQCSGGVCSEITICTTMPKLGPLG